MRISFALRSALLFGALVLVLACGGPAPSQPPVNAGRQLTIQVNDSMQFAPASIAVEAGQPFELTLQNVGNMPHDFSLSEGVARPVKIEVGAGESATGTFTIDKPGTYSFVCAQPLHALGGMRGTIVAR